MASVLKELKMKEETITKKLQANMIGFVTKGTTGHTRVRWRHT